MGKEEPEIEGRYVSGTSWCYATGDCPHQHAEREKERVTESAYIYRVNVG